MIQHVCRYALYALYQCPSDGLDLVVVVEMDGRTRYLLRYDMVRYYLWAEKGMLVCMRACTCAGRCWAGRCGAVRCCAVLASLSEFNE